MSEIVINDLDLGIYSFWKAVVEENERFINDVIAVPVTIQEWKKQKAIYNKYISDSPCYELGFATFYLNRTNRSGIIKAGPIGGMSQKGKWKLDARFNKNNLIARIRRIGSFRNNITVTNIDIINSFDKLRLLINENTFIYFDPPYVNKGKDLYMNFLSIDDHIRLRNSINTIKDYYWITTYDKCPVIIDLYAEFSTIDLKLKYSLYKKAQVIELMISSHRIIFPDNL